MIIMKDKGNYIIPVHILRGDPRRPHPYRRRSGGWESSQVGIPTGIGEAKVSAPVEPTGRCCGESAPFNPNLSPIRGFVADPF